MGERWLLELTQKCWKEQARRKPEFENHPESLESLKTCSLRAKQSCLDQFSVTIERSQLRASCDLLTSCHSLTINYSFTYGIHA